MPQMQLPIFPAGVTPINQHLAVQCRQGQVVYFNGHLPVFTHEQKDVAAFRLFTSQLVVNGTASQAQIVRAFGVPSITVKRCVKKYRQEGDKGLFAPPKPRPGKRLTPEVLAQAQRLLDQGLEVPQVSAQTGVLANTLHKAIRAGRLKRSVKKKIQPLLPMS